MNQVIEQVESGLNDHGLTFIKKPIIIGGMAMEYYGMRKSGADIDLVISNKDYLALSGTHPDKRKDIYGDLGLVIGKFEIWRSIALLDRDFFLKDAIDEGSLFVVSLDRLLLMRVYALEVEKYKQDLMMMKEYYDQHFRNQDFFREAQIHIRSYDKSGGIIWSGQYIDS